MTSIIDIDSAGFQTEVLGSPGPVLVDYVREGCVWCDRLEPLVAAAAERHAGKLPVYRIDVGRYPDTAPGGGLRGTPTLAFFRNGKLVMSKTGMQAPAQLEVFLTHYLDPANTGLS